MSDTSLLRRVVLIAIGLALAAGFLRAAGDTKFKQRQAELRAQWKAEQQKLGYTDDTEGRKRLFAEHPSPEITLCKAIEVKPGASASIEVTGRFPEGTVAMVDRDEAELASGTASGGRFSTTVRLETGVGPGFVRVHFFSPVSGGTVSCAVAFADVAQSFDLKADNGWTVQAKAKANSYEMDRNGYAVLDYAVEFYKPGEAKPFQAMTARRQIEPGRTDDGQFYLSLAEAGSGAMAELMELQKKFENPEALMKMPDKERDALMEKLTELSEKAMKEQMAAVSDPAAMQRRQDEFGCQTLTLRTDATGSVSGSLPCGKNVGTLALTGSAKVK